jgi:hypothetical protein
MIKRLALLAVILLVSGCICCGGANPADLISGKKSTDTGSTGAEGTSCSKPYIQSGGECCMDENDNGVCDMEESGQQGPGGGDMVTDTTQPEELGGATETTLIEESGDSTGATDTTLASADDDNPTITLTSVGQSATTTASTVKTNSAIYNCVRSAGFDPEKVYYGYSPSCGAKFKSDASTSSVRTGIDITPVNIAVMSDDPVMKLLECFYGPYSETNPAFGDCPKLFCPKTGSHQTLSGTISTSALSQMSGFAKKCK